MTPLDAIESMAELELLFGDKIHDYFRTDLWPDLKLVLQEAVQFDFGTAAPDQAHCDFANDLIDREMFKLPYPAVFYTGQCSPQTGVLAMSGREDPTKPLDCIIFTPCFIGDDPSRPRKSVAAVPSISVMIAGNQCKWGTLVHGGNLMGRSGHEKGESGTQRSAHIGLRLALGWTTLMMSKDVETVKLDAPFRLNRARAARGKPPLKERFIVKIRPEARERQRLAAEGFARNSPRMHWRRGHFRQLNEKHGGAVIPIAPQIINAAVDGAKPLIKKYEIG